MLYRLAGFESFVSAAIRFLGWSFLYVALTGLFVGGILASGLPARAAPGDDVAPSNRYGKVALARIEGPIDRLRRRYLARVIDDARSSAVDTVIVHIDTDGGEVTVAREMFKSVLDQARDGPRMIAYIDYRAISAGAMIAYAHEAIYVAPTASIGDIGVIFRKSDGEIAYAPEKIETVIRTLLAQAAEQRGWDRALLMKMTARNQILYRINEPSGSTRYVIQDDLPSYLSEHPDIDPDNKQQVVVYRGEDRLLTLTGPEAIALGMATGAAGSLSELYQLLDIDQDAIIDLSPRASEISAWWLAGFGPILAGLALLFILFELKTPGVGMWAALGGLFGGLFLMAHFSLDLINNLELVLIVAGAALVVVELFTAFGGGVVGIIGGSTLFAGILMGFLPDEIPFEPGDEEFQRAFISALLDGIYTIGVLTVGIIGFVALTPRSPLATRWALRHEIGGTSAGPMSARAQDMSGRSGVTRESLSPGGTVEIERHAYGARAEHGGYIDAGCEVEVVAVEFGELVVRRPLNGLREPEVPTTASHPLADPVSPRSGGADEVE